MKRLIALIIPFLMGVPLTPSAGQAGEQTYQQATETDASLAIKQTALNYMTAWYQGDAGKMKASLHKNLAKRSLQYASDGSAELKQTKASQMVWYTKSGIGQGLRSDNDRIDVIVLDHYQNIASVKIVAPHYYEYLHLVKIDGTWTIINALYENKSPFQKKAGSHD